MEFLPTPHRLKIHSLHLSCKASHYQCPLIGSFSSKKKAERRTELLSGPWAAQGGQQQGSGRSLHLSNMKLPQWTWVRETWECWLLTCPVLGVDWHHHQPWISQMVFKKQQLLSNIHPPGISWRRSLKTLLDNRKSTQGAPTSRQKSGKKIPGRAIAITPTMPGWRAKTGRKGKGKKTILRHACSPHPVLILWPPPIL